MASLKELALEKLNTQAPTAVKAATTARPVEGKAELKAQALATLSRPAAAAPSTVERVAKTVTGGAKSTWAGYLNAEGTLAEALGRAEEKLTGQKVDHGAAMWEAPSMTPKETMQMADRVAQSAAEDTARAKEGLGKVGQTLVDVGTSGTQMLLDAPLNVIAPGAGLAGMGVRAFGSGAQQARQAGAGLGRQIAYGAGTAAVEVATEKMFDGLAGLYGGGAWDDVVEQRIKDLAKTEGGRKVLRVLAGAAGEGAEELVSGAVDPALQSIYNGKKITENYSADTLKDMGHDALVGAILGGLGSGAAEVRGAIQARNSDPLVAAITESAQNTPPNAAGGRSGGEGVSQPIQSRGAVRGLQGDPLVEALTGQTKTAPTREAAGRKPGTVVKQLRENIQMLSGMEPVATVTGTELPGQGRASERAITFLKSIGNKVFRSGFGEVLFSNTKVKDAMVGHGASGAKIDTIVAVPAVIAQGQQIGYVQNYEGRGFDTYLFGAPVIYKGDPVYVGVVVAKDKASGRYYVHEVVDSNGNIILDNAKPEGASDGRATTEGAFDTVHLPTSDPSIRQAAPGVNPQSARAGGEYTDPIVKELMAGKHVDASALTGKSAQAVAGRGDVYADAAGQVFVADPGQHIDVRTREGVGDRKVNAFQFDHPVLHEYFAEAARWLKDDLANSVKGERWKTYDADGYVNGMGGVKRYTSDAIAFLLDREGMSYAEIDKALDAIIHNHGQENYAAAKRVELLLDDILTGGYQSLTGEYMEPNEAYIAAKGAIPSGAETIGAQQTPEGPAGVGAAARGFITGEEARMDTSRLADGVLHSNPSRRAAAGGMTREGWNDLFRYRVQSEAQSMQYATEQLYADIGGERTFIRDFDPEGYQVLTDELRNAPAWNGVMTDMAVLIANELERRSNFVALGDPSQAVSSETYLDWVQTMQEKATETGRGTQAWAKWTRYNKEMTPELRLSAIEHGLSKYAKEAGVELEIPEDIRRAYLDAETEGERDAAVDRMVKAIARQLPTSALEKWNSLRYLNMLGNFKTQIRNVTGNTVMREMVRAKDAVAVGLEGIAHAISGGKFERTKALLPGKALVDAAKADFANVERAALGDGKYSVREGRGISNEILDRAQEEKQIFRTAPMEAYRRATSWAMEKGDVIFSRSAYAGALAGWLKAHGITAEQFQSAEWQSNNAETVEKARQYAIREAQEATFRDSNAISSWVSKIARGDKTPRAVRVAMEGILPFRKTPANVAVRAVEYSPIGLLTSAAQAVGKGLSNTNAVNWRGPVGALARVNRSMTGADIVNQLSKGLTGTGLFALGMALRSLGALRGGADDDDRQEAFDKLTGHQDYSLELPDGTSYTLDWLTPAAMPLFMGVGFYDAIRENGMEAGDILSALESAGEAFLNPMLEMSMLSGISDTLDSVAYSDNRIGRLVAQAAIGYFSQGISNTLLGQLERTSEENRMSTYTVKGGTLPGTSIEIPTWLQYELGRLSAKTPGWEYRQREYTDAWGRTQSNGDPVERALINLFSPGYVSHIREDDTERELRRVAEATGDTTVYPGTAAKKYTIGGKDIYMTMEDYSEYAKALGEYRREYYADLLLSPLYAAMSDEDKAEAIGKMESYAGYRGKKDVDPAYNGSSEMQAYAKADGAGIDPVAWILYKSSTKELTADKDENGKTISGSKKAKVVEVIDRMEISREAKDYLYLQVERYGEKELSNMPWNR